MKLRLLLAFILAAPAALAATTPEEFRAALEENFRSAPPELSRYNGLTPYGETLSGTRRSAESLHGLQALYADAKRLGLVLKPDAHVIALCHELIVYRTPEGMDCLRTLATLKEGPALNYLPLEIMTAGEAGEQLAIERLHDQDAAVRGHWAELLGHIAMYPSSVAPLIALAKAEKNPEVKAHELHALAQLGDPAALGSVSATLASRDDAVQAAAIFAYTELRGYDALPVLRKLKPAGGASGQELTFSIQYLEDSTSPQSKFGTEIGNDVSFWNRFADLENPVIRWIAQSGLEARLASNPRLSKDDKRRLFELLEDSKGFGLEAVKGSLRASAERADIAPLLRIRQTVWISPNEYSEGRMASLDILIRGIRREVK